MTTYENGRPVATAVGLNQEEAVEAIRRAMYGDASPDSLADLRAQRSEAQQERPAVLAA